MRHTAVIGASAVEPGSAEAASTVRSCTGDFNGSKTTAWTVDLAARR
jgi:hypothetical protein